MPAASAMAQIGSASWSRARLGRSSPSNDGHAHAEQPHRPRRRVLAQQRRARPRRPPRASLVACGDRAGAGDRRPVVEPHLDRDRAPAALAGAAGPRRAAARGRRGSPRAARVGDVVVERRLARLADRHAHGLDLGRALEARAAHAATGPGGRRTRCASSSSSAPRQRAERVDPQRASAARRSAGRSRARATAATAAKRSHACSRVSTTNPRGFSASEATFATSRLGPIPIDALEPGRARGSRRTSRRIARLRRDEAVEVQVGLVEAQQLDALDVRAHDRHDRRDAVAVGLEVGRDHDRIGAQAPRPRGRHRRADPEAPRLVGRGRHDGARAGARRRSPAGRAARAGAAARRSRRTRRDRGARPGPPSPWTVRRDPVVAVLTRPATRWRRRPGDG